MEYYQEIKKQAKNIETVLHAQHFGNTEKRTYL